MVRVIDFKTRETESGESFNALIVQGKPEPIKSKRTGKIYFSTQKTSVPSTFDKDTCKDLIGTSFEGSIKKVSCEPYEYTIKETGEIVELSYRYEYVNEEIGLLEEQTVPEAQVM